MPMCVSCTDVLCMKQYLRVDAAFAIGDFPVVYHRKGANVRIPQLLRFCEEPSVTFDILDITHVELNKAQDWIASISI